MNTSMKHYYNNDVTPEDYNNDVTPEERIKMKEMTQEMGLREYSDHHYLNNSWAKDTNLVDRPAAGRGGAVHVID